MAADGYGTGTVSGTQEDRTVTIKTSQTVRNFSFSKDPDPWALYEAAADVFERINRERHLEH